MNISFVPSRSTTTTHSSHGLERSTHYPCTMFAAFDVCSTHPWLRCLRCVEGNRCERLRRLPSPDVGSSRKIMVGCWTVSTPIETRRFSPASRAYRHIMANHTISYCVIPRIPCHIMPYPMTSHIMPIAYPVISYLYHAMSFHIISCHIMNSILVLFSTKSLWSQQHFPHPSRLSYSPPEIPLWISLPIIVSAQFWSFSSSMVSSTSSYFSFWPIHYTYNM